MLESHAGKVGLYFSPGADRSLVDNRAHDAATIAKNAEHQKLASKILAIK